MNKLVDRTLVLIILLTPATRIINGYATLIGDGIQILFLLLFLLKFLSGKFEAGFFTINAILLIQLVLKIYLYGFETDYIKLYIIFALIALSLNEEFITHLKLFIMQNKGLIIFYILLLNFYLVYALGNSSSYYEMYGESYFKGSMYHPHTMAYACLFIILLIMGLMVLYQNKLILVLGFIPIYCINMTGVRTVFIALIIPLLVYFIRSIRNLRQALTLIFGISLSVLTITTLLKDNPIVVKFFITNNDVSSGRFTFWKIDLLEYIKFNPFEKMFGSSFKFLEIINEKYFGLTIGAHNDLIELLLGIGFIGLLTYFIMLTMYLKHIRIEFIALIIILVVLNGFYYYSEIVYILPALLLLSKQEILEVIYEKNCYC